MKKITKDNNGITLIALIITIIVMLILVSVATYTGLDTYENTKVNHFVAQMQLIQAKVDEMNTEEINNLNLDEVTTESQRNAINNAFKNGEIKTNDTAKYKVFSVDNIINILNIDDAENEIMVNFETREIVSSVGIKYDNITYYTQYKLPNGQNIFNSNIETRNLSFELKSSIDGLNDNLSISNISITNGTISFTEDDLNSWKTITNYTEKGKTYKTNISKSGTYTFKLQDNTDDKNSVENKIKIVVTNKPKTNQALQPYNYGENSSSWAYAQDSQGAYYVWIPRFVYKTGSSTEIKFIKGNSNIATDNTYITDGWTLHDIFKKEGGTQLTGIWIKTNKAENLNMLTLLDDSNKQTLEEINIVNE